MTEQWFSLPKIQKAKKVKANDRAKSFLNTDFTYEDLENRSFGLDSLSNLGSETLDGKICKVIMAWPKDKSSYFCRKIWVNSQSWRIARPPPEAGQCPCPSRTAPRDPRLGRRASWTTPSVN